jgi:ABC-type multidrug transport system permease subunit
LRQDFWRAGHAHAGVWLILALVALRYVDEAKLSDTMKWLVRGSIPIAAILVPSAFFLSVLSPHATAPSGVILLAYVGAVLLAVGVFVLGVGLVRRPAPRT